LETRYALSIVAKTGTASDALSTTLLLLGPEKGKRIVMKMAHTAAIWVSPEGHTEMVSNGAEIVLGDGEQKVAREAQRSRSSARCRAN